MYRTFKRQLINLSEEDKQYLFDNMWYRHQLYNLGIECILDYRKENPKLPSSTLLYHMMKEKISDKYNKNYYAEGIESVVRVDISRAIRNTYNNYKKYDDISEQFRFHRFNKYYRSFGFSARSYISYGKMSSRVKSMTNNSITIRFRKGIIKTFYHNELSWNNKNHPYEFDMYDVKEIHFLYDHGKFYIILMCEVNFKNPYRYRDDRMNLAGIDLGERNPAMIYDGKEYIKVKFPDKKIKNIQNRINVMNIALSGKVYGSNNYYKLKNKIDKLYRKQVNIRKDWRHQNSYKITNLFKTIVVDEFHNYIITKDSKENINSKGKRIINRVMEGRGISYFIETLKDMSNKYRCGYYLAEPNTTRTCSKCGFINDPIPLSQEYLVCDNCGKKIHRDKNAAKNCYNQHKRYYHINVYI